MKYRIWHEPTQQFVKSRVDSNGLETNYFIYPDSNGILICEDVDGGSLIVSDCDDYEIQYSSGLKDARGDEIYEGDIIRIDFRMYGTIEFEVCYGECELEEEYNGVEYFTKMLGWYLKEPLGNKQWSMLDIISQPCRISIIGTIFNQP